MESHNSHWTGKTVLVTGCTGFLGNAVTRELLASGARVVGLIRNRKQLAAFAHEQRIGQFRPLFGHADDFPRMYSALVVHEVTNVFDLATASSGARAIERAVRRYHPWLPVVSAQPQAQLRLTAVDQTGLLGIARFDELFGSGDRHLDRIVPRTAQALCLDTRLPQPPRGPTKDFVYVHDAARACLQLAMALREQNAPLDIHFRSGWSLTESEMVTAVQTVYRVGCLEKNPGNPDLTLGWKPLTTLSEALAETLAWHQNQLCSSVPQFSSQPIARAA